MRFQGRVAVVTGAGSGIGRATARRLAHEGALVEAFDIDGEAASHTARSIVESGGQASAHEGDVASTDSIRGFVRSVAETRGRIDVLVNNAAVAAADDLVDIDDDAWDRELDIALGGTFRMTREIVPHLIERGGGAIVNLGSVNGRSAFGQEAYSAAKAGIESLTRSTATRYARHRVRANTVVPGTVRTEAWDERVRADPQVLEKTARWYPLGRVGEPEDIAAAIAFLASDDSSWITGASLLIDGGLLASGFGLMDMVSAPRGDA